MTMDLLRTDCKLVSPNSLQLCINLLGAGVDSNWSVYSASGLDLFIDLGIKLNSTAAAATTTTTTSRDFELDRHDHLSLAASSRNVPDSFPPHEQRLQLLQSEQSACRTAASSGDLEELEENAQSICEPIERLTHHDEDPPVQLLQQEGEESGAVTNSWTESECEDCMFMDPLLTPCPSNIWSQIESFDMADVSAACNLLELSSFSGSVGSSGQEQQQSSTEAFHHDSPGQHFSDFFLLKPAALPADDEESEERNQSVDRLKAALPGRVQLSKTSKSLTGTEVHNMGSNTRSTFRKRRVRANLIKQTDVDVVVSQMYFDDWDFEVDVLDRPPAKRRNRRIDIMYKRSIQV